jgi:hypothetical protein
MKTRMISLLVILVCFFSCGEEDIQVEGSNIPDADKTTTVILSNIPAGFTGGTVYILTLNNQGQVYAIQEAEATEGAAVQVAPVPGISSFSLAALIPTVANWSSQNPFTAGHYSRATTIQDKDGVFVTKTWTNATTLANAPTTGMPATIQAELLVNNSATPGDTEFTKGEIVTLDATVTDNIKSSITSVAFLLDETEIKSYTTKPYKFQFNTINTEAGSHWLYVKALNAEGHEALDSINIYVGNVAGNVGPSIAFNGLTNGAQITRQTVYTINTTVSDPDDGIAKVEFRINNTLVASDDTAPYAFVWDTYDNNVGAVTVEVTAFDKAGQSRSDVVNVTLVAPSNYAPRATIQTPTHGASFPVGHASIDITATATDPEGDAINRVEFWYRKSTAVSDTFIGQDTTSPYAFTFNTSALPAGTYYIFAKVVDNNGNSSYDSVTITIQ